jgi:hypothetical protein
MRKIATAPAAARADAAVAAAAAKPAPPKPAAAPSSSSTASTAPATTTATADDFSSWELVSPAGAVAGKPLTCTAPPPMAPPVAAAEPAAPALSAAEYAAAAGEWSAPQQAALEAALKAVDKKAADRWEQISEFVPGTLAPTAPPRLHSARARSDAG